MDNDNPNTDNQELTEQQQTDNNPVTETKQPDNLLKTKRTTPITVAGKIPAEINELIENDVKNYPGNTKSTIIAEIIKQHYQGNKTENETINQLKKKIEELESQPPPDPEQIEVIKEVIKEVPADLKPGQYILTIPQKFNIFFNQCIQAAELKTGHKFTPPLLLLDLFAKQLEGPGDHLPMIYTRSEKNRLAAQAEKLNTQLDE